MRNLKGWVVLAAIPLSLSAASSPPMTSFFSADLGLYVTSIERRLNAGANADDVSSFSGFIRARRGMALASWLSIEPSFGSIVPWRGSADGFAKVLILHTCLDFGIVPLRWLKFRFGSGLFWQLTLSNEETVTLNNGGGTTAFYVPGGSQSSYLFSVQGGLEVRLSETWSVLVDTWVTGIANPSLRNINGAVSLGVHL